MKRSVIAQATAATVAAVLCLAAAPSATGDGPWRPTFEVAKEAAKESRKDILVYLYSPRASLCVEMRNDVLTPAYVAELTRSFELVEIDVFENNEVVDRIAPLIVKFPVILILHASGEQKLILKDMKETSEWKGELDRLLREAKVKSPLVAPTYATESIDELLAKARSHMMAKRVDEAKDMYLRVLTRDPGEIRALHNLAIIQAIKEEYQTAAQYFALCAQYQPDDKQVQASLERARKLVTLFRDAGAAQDAKDYAKSEALYKEALTMVKHSVKAYRGLANCYEAQQRFPDALEQLEAAAKVAPKDETLKKDVERVKALVGQ